MRTYVTLFTLAFFIALLITPLVRRKAIAWGAVAVPDDGRHIHTQPTPRLGGVAIYLAFALTLLGVPLLGNMVGDIFRAQLPELLGLLVPATLIFLFGIYDDFRGAAAPLKLVFQISAAVMVYAAGFRIENLSSPFGGTWRLPSLLGFALTVLWVIVITNAFNLIDGIDGLAAGASVFALISILIFSVAQENPEISLLALVLVGAVMGFLRYNFNPATIFLGDSGSLFLGFMAAALSLAGSQKGSTIVAIAIPLVSFGLPVTEAGLSLARRFLSGQSLFAGDRGHIHHMLLQRGLTQRQAVILLYAVCALFSLFGLMLLNPQRNLAALIFFVLGVGIVFGVQRLRYAEFAELGNQLKQGVTRRRRALAAGVRVRRTSDDLSQARKPAQLFAALATLMESSELDCATLEVSREFPLTAYNISREWPGRNRSYRVIWVWERAGVRLDEVFLARQLWSLRLPLIAEHDHVIGTITFYRSLLDDDAPAIEIGHLCGTLRRELSDALVRLASDELAQARTVNG